MRKENLSFLERSRAIRTLVCLYKSASKRKKLEELLEEIGGSRTTAMKRISELVEMGLVEKKADRERSKVMLYSLTDNGKIVAEKLLDIIKKIESDVDG